jgi:putative transposase
MYAARRCYIFGLFWLKALACAARHARHGKPPAVRMAGKDAMQRNSSLSRMVIVQVAGRERKKSTMAQKANGLARTKWMCKCRIVSCPKHGRKAICSQCREDLGTIPRQPCQWKGVGMVEGHLAPDHVHMLVSIPPKISVPGFMGCLKGKSALLMSGRHASLKYRSGNRKLWAEGPLRLDRRPERGHDREVHQGAGSCGHRPRQAQRQGVRGPVQQEIGRHMPVWRAGHEPGGHRA